MDKPAAAIATDKALLFNIYGQRTGWQRGGHLQRLVICLWLVCRPNNDYAEKLASQDYIVWFSVEIQE